MQITKVLLFYCQKSPQPWLLDRLGEPHTNVESVNDKVAS
jgi:hypothetical protein